MTSSSDDELPPPVLTQHVIPQSTRARPAAPLVHPQRSGGMPGERTVVVSSHEKHGLVKEATKDGIVVAFIGCHGKRRKRFSVTKFGDSARTHVDAWVESESKSSKEAASLALQLPGTSSGTQSESNQSKEAADLPTGATGAQPKTQKNGTPPATQTTGATSATGAKKPKKVAVVKTPEEAAAIATSVCDVLSKTTTTRTRIDEKWVDFCKRRLPILAKQFPGEKALYMKIASGEFRRPVG